ncbi:MAG: DUF6599 family protein [Bacteroidales bacterium]
MTKAALVASLVLVVLAASALPLRAQDDAQLLPGDNVVAGWKKAEAPKRFTQADLYGYIDGGAELFLEYGFEQLTVQKYRNGPDDYTVEEYRMTDPTAAMGVYLMKTGKETPIPGFKERHTANRNQLMAVRNRYFLIVNNLSGKDSLAPLEAKFASAVAANLPPAAPIPELKSLPAAGLLPGSIRLSRGAYALQAVFTLGEGNILQLDRKQVAVSGDYKTPQGTYTLILADYGDAAQATRAFDYLRRNLDQYLKVVDQKPARFVFQDYAKKFGVASVGGRRIEIRVKLPQKP